MDIRSREAALKRRNDELDACQTLYGCEDNIPTPSYMQEQQFDTPLLSRQDSVQDVNITSTIEVEECKSRDPSPVRIIFLVFQLSLSGFFILLLLLLA